METLTNKIRKILETGMSDAGKRDEILQAIKERDDIYRAYCSCGDALERTGLYPNEAKYYCSGDDTTYKLVEV